MKYPKLKAAWTPVENPHDFTGVRNQQVVSVYKNGELILQEEHPEWVSSAEFFVPAWDKGGKLLIEPTEIMFTVQTFSPLEYDQKILEGDVDSFSSEIISSETIQLSSLSTDDPSNLEVFVMPFPENYQEYEAPHNESAVVDSSSVIIASGVI